MAKQGLPMLSAPCGCISTDRAARPSPLPLPFRGFADLTAEKMARGLLKSSVDKALSRTATVIVDSCNGNKGYRYELWCIARLVRTHYCLLFVDTPEEQCRAWNGKRAAAERYAPEALDDALFRCVSRAVRAQQWVCERTVRQTALRRSEPSAMADRQGVASRACGSGRKGWRDGVCSLRSARRPRSTAVPLHA